MGKKFKRNADVRVLFLGTPAIAVKPLLALIENNFQVVGVVCQEDKAKDRSAILEAPATKKVAMKFGIPVFQPQKIRLDYSFAKDLAFDVIVCMAYGQIVPMDFIDLAPHKAINLHGSLLPKYRGAAPIQRAIMAGEKESGITLMEMVAAMDAGRMYDKKIVKIEEEDDYTSLSAKLSSAAADIIVKDLIPYVNGELLGSPQNENEVSIAKKINPSDEHLPLNLGKEETRDYIRGLSIEPGVYIIWRGKKLKIFASHLLPSHLGKIGTLLPSKKGPILSLKDGDLCLDSLQLEGKKRMDGPSFVNGAHLEKNGETVS